MTVEWAFDRYSFGRPLASYQALKHRFADMMMLARGEPRHQRRRLRRRGRTAPPTRAELVSAAKAYIGQYGAELLQDCVQLHGGIGVTFEHDLHLFLRRVTVEPCAGRHAGGPPPAHRRHRGRHGKGRRRERPAGGDSRRADDMEDLEDFRHRARAFIRSNLRQVTPEELRLG